MILRKIHYCWYGGTPEDPLMQRCLASWSRHMPGWEIKRWDERNTPVHFRFMRTVQKNKSWAKMSDFMRLLALYLEGGVYMDTDVEVIRPFDELLRFSAFVGIETGEPVVCNAVFGAERAHPFILQCLHNLLRTCDGTEPANVTGPILLTSLLRRAGLVEERSEPQTVADITIMPRRYFYPFSYRETFTPACVTPDTFAVHWWAKRWD